MPPLLYLVVFCPIILHSTRNCFLIRDTPALSAITTYYPRVLKPQIHIALRCLIDCYHVERERRCPVPAKIDRRKSRKGTRQLAMGSADQTTSRSGVDTVAGSRMNVASSAVLRPPTLALLPQAVLVWATSSRPRSLMACSRSTNFCGLPLAVMG